MASMSLSGISDDPFDGHALKRDIALTVGVVVIGGRDGAVGFLGYGLVGRVEVHFAVHAGP